MIVDVPVEREPRRLELVVTRRLNGPPYANHLGLLPGAGSEPASSREYRPGEDDVRRTDWADPPRHVSARRRLPRTRGVA